MDKDLRPPETWELKKFGVWYIIPVRDTEFKNRKPKEISGLRFFVRKILTKILDLL